MQDREESVGVFKSGTRIDNYYNNAVKGYNY